MDQTNHEPQRLRHGRVYILYVRTGLVLLGVLLAAIEWVIDPASISAFTWAVALALVALSPVHALLLRVMRPDAVLLLAASTDSGLVLAHAAHTADPPTQSVTLAIYMVIVGYICLPLTTIAFAIVLAAAVTVTSLLVDAWDEITVIPGIAFVVLALGVATALMRSQLERRERHVQALLHEQRDSLERLRELHRQRDQLIANVSHELRTPLTSIISSIETLQRTDVTFDEATRARMLELASDGGRRLLALVEDLLALESMRSGAIDLHPELLPLGEVALEAATGIDPSQERNITVTVQRNATVHADRMRLLQVLTNLITNALHHGSGLVEVQTTTTDHHARLRVLDEGPGVDEANVSELFRPFASFSRRTDSTGLGLAISRSLVEAHGGSIWYSRTEDARTCFTVELPLAPGDSGNARA